jgi:hypothetical protein
MQTPVQFNVGADCGVRWSEKPRTEAWNWDSREQFWLYSAAKLADRVAQLEAAMADEPLMVKGSMGQPIPNGLLNEIRATYQLISQTLARLKVESSEPSGVLGLVGGNRQRAAANRRWRGPGA